MNKHSKGNKRQGTAVTTRENIDTDVYEQVQKKPKGDNLKTAKAQSVEAVSGTPVAGIFNFFLYSVFRLITWKKKYTLH